MAIPPREICAYDPEAKKYVIFELAGEHGPYWVYESTETGYHLLIPKGEVWRFTDFRLCEERGE